MHSVSCSVARLDSRHMGVPENKGYPLFWGPSNKDPTTIYGTILGSPILGNPPISPNLNRRTKLQSPDHA